MAIGSAAPGCQGRRRFPDDTCSGFIMGREGGMKVGYARIRGLGRAKANARNARNASAGYERCNPQTVARSFFCLTTYGASEWQTVSNQPFPYRKTSRSMRFVQGPPRFCKALPP